MTRRPRGLHPEERDLWDRVASSARPIHPKSSQKAEQAGVPKPKKPQGPTSAFRLGEASARPAVRIDLQQSLSERLGAQPLRMDRAAFRRMLQGKSIPDARIDLHGLTLAAAHPELIRFVLNAYGGGLRLVLVITGKGRRTDDSGPIPARVGALRHQVPQWLSASPLGQVVLQVSTAHQKHGGEGAYYVYLRRAGRQGAVP